MKTSLNDPNLFPNVITDNLPQKGVFLTLRTNHRRSGKDSRLFHFCHYRTHKQFNRIIRLHFNV